MIKFQNKKQTKKRQKKRKKLFFKNKKYSNDYKHLFEMGEKPQTS